MEVTLLGTGAPLSPGRATLGMLFTAPGCAPLLVDTCGGFELARRLASIGHPLKEVRNVIATHRHMDHTGGFPALFLANMPLDIYAIADAHAGIDALVAACYPEWPPHTEVTRTVMAPDEAREIGGFRVQFFPVQHRVETVAVRVSHGGKAITFSADSVPCDSLVEAARGADLFICDALYAELDSADLANHARKLMHPVVCEAAAMARQAGAGALALVHLGRFADPANFLAEARDHFAGPVTVPDDLTKYAV